MLIADHICTICRNSILQDYLYYSGYQACRGKGISIPIPIPFPQDFCGNPIPMGRSPYGDPHRGKSYSQSHRYGDPHGYPHTDIHMISHMDIRMGISLWIWGKSYSHSHPILYMGIPIPTATLVDTLHGRRVRGAMALPIILLSP